MNCKTIRQAWPFIFIPLGGWYVNRLRGLVQPVAPPIVVTCVLFGLWIGAIIYCRWRKPNG